MEIKMLCSIVTKDYTNYTHGAVYKVSKKLGKELVEAGYAVEIVKPVAKKKKQKETKIETEIETEITE